MSKMRTTKKIPPAVLLEAQLKLNEVMNLLEAYFTVLPLQERQALVKIGAESIGFLKLSYKIATEQPDFFPAFMETSAFKEEFFTTYELWHMINKINWLRDNISDTKMLAGNNVMDSAIAFYDTIKIAARRDIPGAKVIYEELKPVLPARKRGWRKNLRDERQMDLFEN